MRSAFPTSPSGNAERIWELLDQEEVTHLNGAPTMLTTLVGAQIDGENYLLPVGEQFASLEDVKRRSVTALAVVEAMASAHSDLNIFILDACRNNPIDPNGAKGLSRIDSNARLFISYATSPGLTALDGEGNNDLRVAYYAQVGPP